MRVDEKYVYWRILSDYDIETAQCLINCRRWPYVTFLCHQAVERLLKGMHIYHLKKETPKSHNLTYLFNRVVKSEDFSRQIDGDENFDKEQERYVDFMIDLMYYYMSDYPFSYKKVMDRFIDEDTAVGVYGKTIELIEWLKKFQTEPPMNMI